MRPLAKTCMPFKASFQPYLDYAFQRQWLLYIYIYIHALPKIKTYYFSVDINRLVFLQEKHCFLWCKNWAFKHGDLDNFNLLLLRTDETKEG